MNVDAFFLCRVFLRSNSLAIHMPCVCGAWQTRTNALDSQFVGQRNHDLTSVFLARHRFVLGFEFPFGSLSPNPNRVNSPNRVLSPLKPIPKTGRRASKKQGAHEPSPPSIGGLNFQLVEEGMAPDQLHVLPVLRMRSVLRSLANQVGFQREAKGKPTVLGSGEHTDHSA